MRGSAAKRPRCWTCAPRNSASRWRARRRGRIDDLELDARGSRFLLSGELDLRIVCPLAGEHQVENAATAAVALTRLGISEPEISAGIAQTRWPGRLERVSEHPEIILDGAHNPAGARALAAYIARFYAARRVRLIYGAMRDKAIDEISGILFPHAQQVIVTAPRQARALAPESIRQVAEHPDLRTAANLRDALAMVQGRHGGGRHLHHRLSVPGGGSAGNAGAIVSESMSLLRSLLFSTPLIVICTIVMGTLSLVDSFFDRTGNSQHQLARAWARMLLAVSFIRVRVEGLEKLDPRGTYVFVANHGSFMDIPALLASLPQQFRFFAKKGLFRIPLSGHASAARRTYAGGPLEPARLVEEHDGSGAHHQRARRFGVELSGRRALGRRAARVQGRPGLHRHQSRGAGGAGGDRGHAGTAADGLDPSAQRQGGAARGRPDPDKRDGSLRSHGVDRAALPRGIAPARR